MCVDRSAHRRRSSGQGYDCGLGQIPLTEHQTVMWVFACRRLPGECSWSLWGVLDASRIRLRGKLNYNAFATEASADSRGSSGVRMALQS